jgi:hypothetical protein
MGVDGRKPYPQRHATTSAAPGSPSSPAAASALMPTRPAAIAATADVHRGTTTAGTCRSDRLQVAIGLPHPPTHHVFLCVRRAGGGAVKAASGGASVSALSVGDTTARRRWRARPNRGTARSCPADPVAVRRQPARDEDPLHRPRWARGTQHVGELLGHAELEWTRHPLGVRQPLVSESEAVPDGLFEAFRGSVSMTTCASVVPLCQKSWTVPGGTISVRPSSAVRSSRPTRRPKSRDRRVPLLHDRVHMRGRDPPPGRRNSSTTMRSSTLSSVPTRTTARSPVTGFAMQWPARDMATPVPAGAICVMDRR